MKKKYLYNWVLAASGILILSMLLSACGALGGGAGNALPTPKPGEDLGADTRSSAKDNYQDTWDSFLRDSIAAANQQAASDIDLLQRYEKPSITAQNLAGTLKSIELVEDRTSFNLVNQETTAAAKAEFDVRLTFANGDTDTRTCHIPAQIELDPDSKKWYVINPGPLAVFSVCG
jgi:hypothetical protein